MPLRENDLPMQNVVCMQGQAHRRWTVSLAGLVGGAQQRAGPAALAIAAGGCQCVFDGAGSRKSRVAADQRGLWRLYCGGAGATDSGAARLVDLTDADGRLDHHGHALAGAFQVALPKLPCRTLFAGAILPARFTARCLLNTPAQWAVQ